MTRAEELEAHGYTDVREVLPGYWCGIRRFMYTVGVCCGMDDTGYLNRFCFESYAFAKLFLDEWDGHTVPVVGEDGCTAIK